MNNIVLERERKKRNVVRFGDFILLKENAMLMLEELLITGITNDFPFNIIPRQLLQDNDIDISFSFPP